MGKTKFIIICSITAAICFGLVSYGHFYRGRAALGGLFAALSIAQIVIAIMNYTKYKR